MPYFHLQIRYLCKKQFKKIAIAVLIFYTCVFVLTELILHLLPCRLDQFIAVERSKINNISKRKCPKSHKCMYIATTMYRSYDNWPLHLHTAHSDCLSRCSLVSDPTEAHSHLFHAFDLPHPNHLHKMQQQRKTGQAWVLFSVETPKLFTFQRCFPGCKYLPRILRNFAIAIKQLFSVNYLFQRKGSNYEAQLFNWTITYLSESTIYYPSFGTLEPRNKLPIPRTGLLPLSVNITKKKHLAYAVVSNCRPYNNRNKIIKLLQTKMDLHVFGDCSDHPMNDPLQARFEYLSDHFHFYLSFENSFCKDYISEKFFKNGLNSNSVPVVFGGMTRNEVEEVAPKKSFIYAFDFPSLEALANYLSRLANNQSEYLSYFHWRKHTRVLYDTYDILADRKRNVFCQLCDRMHQMNSKQPDLLDLNELFQTNSHCRPSGYNPFTDVTN